MGTTVVAARRRRRCARPPGRVSETTIAPAPDTAVFTVLPLRPIGDVPARIAFLRTPDLERLVTAGDAVAAAHVEESGVEVSGWDESFGRRLPAGAARVGPGASIGLRAPVPGAPRTLVTSSEDGDAPRARLGFSTTEELPSLAARLTAAGHEARAVEGEGASAEHVADPDGLALEIPPRQDGRERRARGRGVR